MPHALVAAKARYFSNRGDRGRLHRAFLCWVFPLCIFVCHRSCAGSTRVGAFDQPRIIYRPGRPSDQSRITWTLAKNLENPFSSIAFLPNNYLVAVDEDDEKTLLGWAQIRPMGYDTRDPQKLNASPGSYDLEQDVDDQMWEEFMEDPRIQVPTGLASLPWSPEYRAMEAAVVERQARRQALFEAAQTEERKTRIPLWELASLYVVPAYRRNGIGKALVRRLCDEYLETGKAASSLYVAVKASQRAFFQRCNKIEGSSSDSVIRFEKVLFASEIPQQMALGPNQVCLRGAFGKD